MTKSWCYPGKYKTRNVTFATDDLGFHKPGSRHCIPSPVWLWSTLAGENFLTALVFEGGFKCLLSVTLCRSSASLLSQKKRLFGLSPKGNPFSFFKEPSQERTALPDKERFNTSIESQGSYWNQFFWERDCCGIVFFGREKQELWATQYRVRS